MGVSLALEYSKREELVLYISIPPPTAQPYGVIKMAIIQMLLRRLKEPSTLAGLAGLLAAVGISIPGEMVTQITVIIGGVAGIASMIMREQGEK